MTSNTVAVAAQSWKMNTECQPKNVASTPPISGAKIGIRPMNMFMVENCRLA